MKKASQNILSILIAVYLSTLGSVFATKEALLIANGDYAHFGKLPNPISDARLLSSSLKQIGFQVSLIENASREGMLEALDAFEQRLKASRGVAFFHYGGHGVQVNGHNYLVPADADIPDEKRVVTRAVELEEVMTALDASGASASIVVLDACRDNPLPATSTRSATRGLSVVQAKPKNSIIIYAAEAGSKANDGLFTPILAKAITAPGRPITEVVMDVRRQVNEQSNGSQTPGEYNQLFEQIVLAEAGGNSAVQSPLPPMPQTASYQPSQITSSEPLFARNEYSSTPRNNAGSKPQAKRTIGASFSNSLGQKYVPIPGLDAYFCIWDTRVSDYEKFVKETNAAWKPAGFPQGKDHPAVRVTYNDAVDFCKWLTSTEQALGSLPLGYEYRLPKDLEWSAAAGISGENEGQPSWRSGAIASCYAWGSSWPPPPNSGNYDPRLKTDKFPNTSPVGSFAPNKYGLYDMNGNVYQWIEEDYNESGQGCLRGGSWPDEQEESINLTNRWPANRDDKFKCYGFRCVLAPK